MYNSDKHFTPRACLYLSMIILMAACTFTITPELPTAAAQTGQSAAYLDVKNDFAYDESTGAWYWYDSSGSRTTVSGLCHGTINGVEGDYYCKNGKKADTTGTVTISGKTYLLEDGRLRSEFTGLYKMSTSRYYYFNKGVFENSYTGFVSASTDAYGSGEYYCANGVVTISTVAQTYNGKTYYLENGKKKSVTGFYYISAKSSELTNKTTAWWYFKNGVLNETTGFVNGTINGTKADWYVDTGRAQTGLTGIVKTGGKYYYIESGRKKTSGTGFVYSSLSGTQGYWYLKNGTVQTGTGFYSGTINGNKGRYYVKNGKVQNSLSGFQKISGTWYYLTAGRIMDSTGLVYGTINNESTWFYIKSGVYKKSTGVFPLVGSSSQRYYTAKGRYEANFAGCYNDGSNVWYVQYGQWQSSKTGVYTDTSGKMWYIKNGKADKSYSGTKTFNRVTYSIKKGVASYKSMSLAQGGSSSNRSKVNKQLRKADKKLLALFAQDGGTIKLTNKNLGSDKYGEYWGLCSGSEITIKNTSTAANFVTLHELGHWIDHYAARTREKSSSTEWSKITKSEIKKYRRAFPRSEVDAAVTSSNSTSEYFADAFKMYFAHKSTLKKKCPKTYNYLKSVINNVEKGKVNTTYLDRPYVTSFSSNGKSVSIKWASSAGAVKYRVYRKTSKNGSWKKLADTSKTSYTDKSAKKGRQYYYAVRCINSKGTVCQSGYSKSYAMKITSTPKLKKASASSGKIKVSWKKTKNAAKYRVYRKTGKNGKWKSIGTTSKTSYTDKKVKKGKTYYYTVCALTSSGRKASAYNKTGVHATGK